MNHLGTRQLETDRLILRQFSVKDASAMYRNWASDPEVTRFLTWPVHGTEDISRKILADWERQYDRPEYYQWAIVWKDLNEPIGSISVVSQNEELEIAHIGYCIGRKFWNQGFTSEALSRVMAYLFDEVGFRRIESRHDPRNIYSGMVMKKCGMRFEGTLRQSDWNNQGICDASWYGILASDR